MIIESPGKVEKLKAILGPDWRIAASAGHIRDLPEDEMGVSAPDYVPKYVFMPGGLMPGEKTKRYPGKKETVDRIAALVNQAEVVYLATDPDREGESISWHLQQALKLKNPLRVAFAEITPAAVKAALLSPRSIDVKLVAAQEARRVLDRLVGYMVSPAISDLASETLSAGRVQSPAVWLVVQREREIRAFKPTSHFGVQLSFAGAKLVWVADWKTKPDFVTDDSPYFMDAAFAQTVKGTPRVTVTAFKADEQRRGPPPPFTTSKLQQAASVKLGMSPKATMDAAQRLFEQGHITYHRTDNPNVSDEALGDIFAVAVKLGLEMADEPREFKAPDGAQAGHPAITPTHWDVEEAGDNSDELALYKLIRTRAIACQLADARYAVHSTTLSAPAATGSKNLTFTATGRTLVFSGWLKLLAQDDTEEATDEPEALNPVPMLAVGDVLEVKAGQVQAKQTKAPRRYTEASLVDKLEAEGIGRPSTFASIMETIVVRRQYLQLVKKFLQPTPKGEAMVDALVGKFDFVETSYTRAMEEQLDAIAGGRAGYKAVVERMHGLLQEELSQLLKSAVPKFACPTCGLSLRRIVVKGKAFWGCSGHPTCTETLTDEDGKPGVSKSPVITDFACEKCGKPLIHRRKQGAGGYDFFGCSGIKDGCKQSYENKDGKPLFSAAT